MRLVTAKTPNLKDIQKKSDAIFNVFTRTKAEAEALHSHIHEVAAQKEEANAILAEVASMKEVATKNINLANKINEFFNS